VWTNAMWCHVHVEAQSDKSFNPDRHRSGSKETCRHGPYRLSKRGMTIGVYKAQGSRNKAWGWSTLARIHMAGGRTSHDSREATQY